MARRGLLVALAIGVVAAGAASAAVHSPPDGRSGPSASTATVAPFPTVPGLNADFLDNRSSEEFASAGHLHDERYYTEAESDARFLAIGGKAADADALDGLDSSVFLRRDGSGSIAGSLTLSGDLSAAGAIRANGHITHLPWFNLGAAPQGPWVAGHVKLVTPIAEREGNMFSLHVFGYRYGSGGTPVEIRCGGYAYESAGLLATACNTEGTHDAVGIGVEDGVVVVTIGSGQSPGGCGSCPDSWYFDHFTAEYVGWTPKEPGDFRWEFVAATPPAFANTNNVVINDRQGTVTATTFHAASGASLGDVAEPVLGDGLDPGTVVELDGRDAVSGKLRVRATESAFSPAVVGVVSTSPSIVLAGLPTDVPLAVTGIVPVKVVGPVAPGDLLASSATRGHAQACRDASECFGAVLGKAIEAHAGDGAGVVHAIVGLA